MILSISNFSFYYYYLGKKLVRGISRATENFSLVTKARKEVAEDFDCDQSSKSSSLRLETPDYTFSLPDFSAFSENLREYLQRDLIETATLVSLEQAGIYIFIIILFHFICLNIYIKFHKYKTCI